MEGDHLVCARTFSSSMPLRELFLLNKKQSLKLDFRSCRIVFSMRVGFQDMFLKKSPTYPPPPLPLLRYVMFRPKSQPKLSTAAESYSAVPELFQVLCYLSIISGLNLINLICLPYVNCSFPCTFEWHKCFSSQEFSAETY